MTFVVYDESTGSVIMTMNDTEINGKCTNVEIPEGKVLNGFNLETQEPIFVDKPLSLEERLALLESSQNDQDEAITELAEILGGE